MTPLVRAILANDLAPPMACSAGAVIQETFDCAASYIAEAMESRTRVELAARAPGGHPAAAEPVVFQVKRCWQQHRSDPERIARDRYILEGRWAGKRLPLLVRARVSA